VEEFGIEMSVYFMVICYFMAIWYISLWPIGIFCGNFGQVLVFCAKKKLVTLHPSLPIPTSKVNVW
jgi:hypothetical protein